jgi:glucose-6-phosphate isomerase
MKDIRFTTQSSLIPEKEIDIFQPQLHEEITRMKAAQRNHYNDDRTSLKLPEDKESLKKIKSMINEKRKTTPTNIVVIGIGGSNLGTIAIQEAILGRMYNQTGPATKILYADTVDSEALHTIISLIEPVLKIGGNVLINGVSKSGGTTETIANFEVMLDIMKKYRRDYSDSIIVTTDRNSKFWNLAEKQGYSLLEIPSKIGGRYSVFSAVGLFPLGILGIDIDDLLNGAYAMTRRCLNSNIQNNPAALSASLIHAHHTYGKNIHDLFLFDPDLESLGKWYRQLMSESIGKEYNLNGARVYNGITPTVSIGSTDLHSMAQLYLGGPYDKFTTFVRVEHANSTVHIPNLPEYDTLVKGIQGRSLHDIMEAILGGAKTAFRKNKRPYVEVTLPDKTAGSIGQFMQFKMMEMMFLGVLCGVNPFDQPNVEAYKQETRNILEMQDSDKRSSHINNP